MSVTIELLADSRIRFDADVSTRSDEEVTFRVEGTLRLTEALLSRFVGRRLTPESVAFSVDENPETDGGSPDDGLFQLRVFGCEIVVWEDGTIVVGRRSDDSTGLL